MLNVIWFYYAHKFLTLQHKDIKLIQDLNIHWGTWTSYSRSLLGQVEPYLIWFCDCQLHFCQDSAGRFMAYSFKMCLINVSAYPFCALN